MWTEKGELKLSIPVRPGFGLQSSQQFLNILSPNCTLVSVSSIRWDVCGACSPTADHASWSVPAQMANFSGGEVSHGGSRWPVRHWLLLPQVFHPPLGLVTLMDVFWVPRYLIFRSVLSALQHTLFLLNFQALLFSSWRKSWLFGRKMLLTPSWDMLIFMS